MSKMDPFRKGVLIHLGRTDDGLCPVGMILAYLAVIETVQCMIHHMNHKVTTPDFIEQRYRIFCMNKNILKCFVQFKTHPDIQRCHSPPDTEQKQFFSADHNYDINRAPLHL